MSCPCGATESTFWFDLKKSPHTPTTVCIDCGFFWGRLYD